MYKYAFSIPDRIVTDSSWMNAIAQAKLKRIEFSCDDSCNAGNIGEKVQILAKAQERGDIIVGSVHIPFGNNWEFATPNEEIRSQCAKNTAAFIEACAPLNCRNFTMHGCLEPVPTEPAQRAECMKAIRRTIADLVPVAEKFNTRINLEDLPRTCLGNTAEELAEMIDGFPFEQIGVCFDVNHFCGHPEKLADGIRLLAKRINTFHISDYDGIDELHWYPGMGVINWPEIMEAVNELSNDVLLMFETFGFLATRPNRIIPHDIILKTYERNVFYLENAAELRRRIDETVID